MGLFDKLRGRTEPSGSPERAVGRVDDELESPADEELPLRPRYAPLSADARGSLDALLAGLAADGVDLDDLASVAALYERELDAWEAQPAKTRPDHAPIVARVAAAVGEYLVRHTDLEWLWVTDAFGSAPAVAQSKDDFVVVPRDLVGVRWLSRRRGWTTNVVGHLERVRADRAPRG